MAYVSLRPASNRVLTPTTTRPPAAKPQPVAPASAAKRKMRRYDPEEEITVLRKQLDQERCKRRELEADILKLKQERSEMCITMSRLEQTKRASNIPQSLVPMLADAMASGLNPAALSTPNRPPVAVNKVPLRPNRPDLVTPVVKIAPGPSVALVVNATPTQVINTTPDPIPKAVGSAAPDQSSTPKLPVTAAVIATPSPSPAPLKLPVTAAVGQKFLIQQKTADGKMVSFLASVAPNDGSAPIAAVPITAASEASNPPSSSIVTGEVALVQPATTPPDVQPISSESATVTAAL
ncbi:calphotin-like [Paramacrobiotus metropolitanus]|uniref:calphotin-like n=1 Tax=Paramacrobiotus metropolitanus TaxID=2943436 RepID=UPI0024462C5E|nr:calphotin-like [Paramacrobiotus metropolitanus]